MGMKDLILRFLRPKRINLQRSLIPTSTATPKASQPRNPQSIRELRELLIQNEHLSAVENETTVITHIVEAGNTLPTTHKKRHFRNGGLQTEENEFLIRTAEGVLVKPSELLHGARCEVCGRYTHRPQFCVVCNKVLCSRHSLEWMGHPVCAQHYKQLRFNQDTWSEDGKGK